MTTVKTEAVFTPGPWEVDGLSVAAHGRGTVAGILRPQAGGCFECVANARLIAAAPDLYEALEMVIRNADSRNRCAPYVNKAIRALARARGDAPSSKGLMDG